MSTKQGRDQLKTYFETGDRPTEEEFAESIDSVLNQIDDDIYGVSKNIGIGTDAPQAKLDVNGNSLFQDQVEMQKGLHVGSGPGRNHLQIHNNINKVVIGHAYGPDFSWASGYLGFNAKRKQVGVSSLFNWELESDGNINGGALIHSNIAGDLHFSTMEGQSGTNQPQVLTDQDMKGRLRMKVTRDGKVGIGVAGPNEKLHVDGNIRMNEGDLLLRGGDNSNGIGYYGGQKSYKHDNFPVPINGTVVYGQLGGALAVNDGGDQAIALRWTEDGFVGIGHHFPTNELHVHTSQAKGKTGLQLSNANGNVAGQILVSDASGNASWASPTVVTQGLWVDAGNNNIQNGNTGNVGINVNSPNSKLHIAGDIRLNDGFNLFLRGGNDPNHGMGWYGAGRQFSTATDLDGPVVHGWKGGALGAIQNNTTGPTTQGQQSIAMKWKEDQSVDFRGNVFLKEMFPFKLARLKFNSEMTAWTFDYFLNGDPSKPRFKIVGKNTGYSTQDFKAAIVVGFATTQVSWTRETSRDVANQAGGGHNHTYYVDQKLAVYTFRHNGFWYVAADMYSKDSHEKWNVDILFIREGIIELDGDWDNPLRGNTTNPNS